MGQKGLNPFHGCHKKCFLLHPRSLARSLGNPASMMSVKMGGSRKEKMRTLKRATSKHSLRITQQFVSCAIFSPHFSFLLHLLYGHICNGLFHLFIFFLISRPSDLSAYIWQAYRHGWLGNILHFLARFLLLNPWGPKDSRVAFIK